MFASAHNKSSQTKELWEDRETLTRLNHTLQSDIHRLTQKLTTEHQESKQRIAKLNAKIWQLNEDLHEERENSKKAKRYYQDIDAKNKRLCKFVKKVIEQRKLYKGQGVQLLSEQSKMERRLLDAKYRLNKWTNAAAKQTTQNAQDILKEIQQLQIQLNIGVYKSICSLL